MRTTKSPALALFFLAFTLLALVATATLSMAQSSSATLSGSVVDQSGAVVPNVKIWVTNNATNIRRETETNKDGAFVVPSLNPGTYSLRAQAAGFSVVEVSNLTLHTNDVRTIQLKLKVGTASQSVTVNGNAIGIDTSPAVGTLVNSQFVQNMPLNGRSFQSLIELTPGVTFDASTTGPGTLSVNGQRTDTNYFMVDGVSANFSGLSMGGSLPGLTVGGGTNGLVSVDDMQEFRVQTSTYAPEYGRTPGAQISIVTKSGTNQWHGTAFDYLRNDIFDARQWADNPPLQKPAERQNDFGGTVSGPIWKDHTFFFFSYEGNRLRLPVSNIGNYFFSADAKAAVANSPTAGLWKEIVAATPTGTGPLLDPTCDNVFNPCLRQLNLAFSNPSSFDAYSLRLDHMLTRNIALFARYNYAPSNTNDQVFNIGQPTSANTQTLTFGATATLSPTLVNDFRGNWSRQTGETGSINEPIYGAVNPPLSDVIPPGINFGVSYAPTFDINANPSWGQNTVNSQRQLNFVDTLSKTAGSHLLKFGVDYRRMNLTQMSGASLGILAFSWTSVLNGTANFVINDTADTITSHVNNLSFFAQDTWNVSPRMTLTYGLRWEINTPPASDTAGKPFYPVEGIFNSAPLALGASGGTLYHKQLDAFAPRVGLAYRITPKTVLRGGFGLFYDLGYGWGAGNLAGFFPNSRMTIFRGQMPLDFSYQDPVTGLHPYQPLPFTTQIGPETFDLQAIDPNLRLPVTYEWNVAVERQLGTAQTITATYVGSAGRNLLYNAMLAGQGAIQTVNAQVNKSSSHYNSLQLQFMRRMSHGLQATASYTYSRSFDNNSGGQGEVQKFASVASIQAPPITPSDFDIPQKFSAAVSYDIPMFARGGRVGEKITKGWALDSIYRYQNGAPINVVMNEIDPVLGNVSVRPTRVSGQPVWISDPSQPAGVALNPAAFTLQANGQSDNALRNSIRSPYGISQVDLALRRQFSLTERVKLDVRAEYFNAFNHPMFGGWNAPNAFWGYCSSNTPASCAASPTFGKVIFGETLNTITAPVPGSAHQGQDALYGVGANRSAQFTLRLSF